MYKHLVRMETVTEKGLAEGPSLQVALFPCSQQGCCTQMVLCTDSP